MKNSFSKIVLLCVSCVFLFACVNRKSENKFVFPTHDLSQYFAAAASTKEILLSTDIKTLNVLSDVDWCSAKFIKTAKNETALMLSANENTGKEKRKAKITIKIPKEESVCLDVIQLGTAPDISIREEAIHLIDELNFNLNIISSVAFGLEMPEWISLENKSEHAGSCLYTFRADRLSQYEDSREAAITVYALNNEIEPVTIPVLQTEGFPCFIVISDAFMGRADVDEKLAAKLKNLLNKPHSIDAVFMVGGLTEWGAPFQYDALNEILNENVPQDIPVYFMLGDTEHYSQKAEETYKEKLNQENVHQYFEMKGFPFITLSMRSPISNLPEEDKNFLIDCLNDAQENYPDKPIFLFTHFGVSNTIYGTEKKGTDLGSPVLESILEKYPQVILFSGHSNFSLKDPRSIHQDKFTSVSTGAGVSTQIEYGLTEGMFPQQYQNVYEGLIVCAKNDNSVEIERWDACRDEEMLPRWIINTPHDGSAFTYKGRSGGEKPFFSKKSKLKIAQLPNGTFTVTFPQASDDELVHHYVINVFDGNEIVLENTKFSDFYLNSETPKNFTVKLFALPAEKPLFVEVKAVDSYGNISEPLRSQHFVVNPFVLSPGVKAPVADLFDVKFGENGTAFDVSLQNVPIESGNVVPTTYFNETYKQYVACFSNNRESFYKVDYTNNDIIKNAITTGFTLETAYLARNIKNSAPLSGKEWEGLGIQHEGYEGYIEFWAYFDGVYRKAKSYVVPNAGEFYHVAASYDKSAGQMTIYVNGLKSSQIDVNGDLQYNKRLDSQWFCVGGDTHPSGKVQHHMDGEVAIARMYSRALSDEEVYLLYQQFEKR